MISDDDKDGFGAGRLLKALPDPAPGTLPGGRTRAKTVAFSFARIVGSPLANGIRAPGLPAIISKAGGPIAEGMWSMALFEKATSKQFPTLPVACDQQLSMRSQGGVWRAIIKHRGM